MLPIRQSVIAFGRGPPRSRHGAGDTKVSIWIVKRTVCVWISCLFQGRGSSTLELLLMADFYLRFMAAGIRKRHFLGAGYHPLVGYLERGQDRHVEYFEEITGLL